MMLTLLQKKKKSLLNVYRNFGLKTPGCYGVYHTQFSVAYFLVSTLLSKIFDFGDRDLPMLTSGNWVIKGWVIKCPVKLRSFFTFFFKVQKNVTFYVFWVGGPFFSNTAVNHSVQCVSDTTGAHTNDIESRRNAVKKSLPRFGTRKEIRISRNTLSNVNICNKLSVNICSMPTIHSRRVTCSLWWHCEAQLIVHLWLQKDINVITVLRGV